MLQPGRKYSGGSAYRYGFNGKENDKDVKGDGNQQDYGMRIYDPRLSKFLSVDPLTSKYPELTPFQFASNCPISGIDIDGLEYGTAIYNVTIKNGIKTLTASFIWFDEMTHNAHGPLGQGVNYQIRINNLDKKTTTNRDYFVSRGGKNIFSGITQYGNYMGSASLTNFDVFTGEKIKNTYRYDVPSVDYVDEQAKLHDQGYDRVNAVGGSSLFNDWGTTPYDEAALDAWTEFYENHKLGWYDPNSKQWVTEDERAAAWRGKTLFNFVVGNKKEAISNFMRENYEKESKSTIGLGSHKKEIQYNYELFLKKYMKKDSDGNWIRRDEMWDGDKEKGFTPKKSTG